MKKSKMIRKRLASMILSFVMLFGEFYSGGMTVFAGDGDVRISEDDPAATDPGDDVTEDEEAELDKIRSNYAAVTEKLAKYESESEKMSILESEDYASISDQKDFEELKKQENHFDLSVEDVKSKADAMLLEYAKKGILNFAKVETKKEEPKRDFFAFARAERDTSFLDGLLKRKN